MRCAHGHGLDLVVGDVDDRRRGGAAARPARRVCTRSLASRFESGSSIRKASGRRTIARERDPLALPARELRGLALEQVAQPEDPRCVAPPAAPLGLAGTLRERSGNSMFRRTVMCG